MLRISGGKYIRQSIKIIDSKDLRPTTSFLREWMFNVLQNYINYEEINLLDLFSGSGIIGMEFMSRGTNNITYIENNSKVLSLIEKNINGIIKDSSYNISYIKNDAEIYFKNYFLKHNQFPFNAVFIDPPYNYNNVSIFLEILDQNFQFLHQNFILLIESFYKTNLYKPLNLSLIKEKKSGQSKLQLYIINSSTNKND